MTTYTNHNLLDEIIQRKKIVAEIQRKTTLKQSMRLSSYPVNSIGLMFIFLDPLFNQGDQTQ